MGGFMTQPRRASALEAIANIAVGMGAGYCVSYFTFHALGVSVTHGQVGVVTAIYTVVSFARQYVIRRAFVWWWA